MAQQQQVNHKFVLGNKELEGKIAEFLYDHGWYSITDIVGEDRNEIYKSRNAQEAYMKWNVYIGRKKERPQREDRKRDLESENSGNRQNQPEGRRNFQNDRRREHYTGEGRSEEQRNRSTDYRTRSNEEKSGEERRTHYNEKRYEQRDQSNGQAYRNEDRGTKKKTYQNKHRRDRKPKGEYKRQKNKVTNYEMEDE